MKKRKDLVIALLIRWSVFFALIGITLNASAQSRSGSKGERDYIDINAYQSTYQNSKVSAASSSTSSSDTLPSSLDVEIAIRLRATYSLILAYVNFQDPDPNNADQYQNTISGFGVGLKIDLPGFFLIGGGNEDLIRSAKKRPFNTFLFGEILKLNMVVPNSGGTLTTSSGRGGFGLDIFPFTKTMYLSLRFSVLNFLGVSYMSPGFGAGINF